jgi:SAM-dependent methyltransferase
VTPSSDACIVCGSSRLDVPVDINEGWQLRACADCEAGTTWPPPAQEQVAANNIEAYPLAERVAIYSTRAAEFRARADQLLEFLPMAPSSIMDFGCNLGAFLARARDRGVMRVAGVEINDACRGWASSSLHLDVRRTMADFDDEHFDVITFQDALEHVSDPHGLLRECSARLNSGGCLFIQLPNRKSDMARRAGRKWAWYSAPDHLMHMTPTSVRTLATLAGLEVFSLRTVDSMVDVWQERRGLIPYGAIEKLRRIPAFQRLRVREGDMGGLIQAVLKPQNGL